MGAGTVDELLVTEEVIADVEDEGVEVLKGLAVLLDDDGEVLATIKDDVGML